MNASNANPLASNAARSKPPAPHFVEVPQEIFSPSSKWHIAMSGPPHASVYFRYRGSDYDGVSMSHIRTLSVAALSDKMVGANDQIFHGSGLQSILLRILWPGHTTRLKWFRQIKLVSKDKRDITRAEIADDIARKFKRYIEDGLNAATTKPEWSIGAHGYRFDQLYLVSLHNVSNGSWQAEVYIRL